MREKAEPWLRELEHERALAKEWSNKNGGRSVWESALENEEPAAKKQKKDEEIVESARCVTRISLSLPKLKSVVTLLFIYSET